MILSSRLSLKFSSLSLAAAALALGLTACGKNKGKVYFGNLQDGAQVESPFTVEMKAENLVVEPAANGVNEGRGHFHILVDVPVSMSMDPIPSDAQRIHYGQGQTEAVLDLPEGEHTLTLQFAKGDHRPFDPQITQTIKVTVTRRNVPPEAAGTDGQGAGVGTGDGAGTAADSLDARTNPNTPVITPAVGGGANNTGGSGMGGGGM
ncbi:MAG: hypothetical protein K0Q91_1379 [Fibrobacteria bacterium]|jgi:predicted small lipoprotein YifL|nr:hypothetical protein [Fibrobacteria bacterium]